MAVFKPINKSDVEIVSTVINKTHTLTHATPGVIVSEFKSGSFNDETNYDISAAGDKYQYYNSLNHNFYSSGAFTSTGKHSPYHSLADTTRPSNKQFVNKWYESGSLISIPQVKYGERIKPGSVTITDLGNTDLDGNFLILVDDSKGNLYTSNAHHSQSSDSSISSSENYVGNVFYNFGIVALTETASWSGSVNYTDLTLDNLQIKFDSTQTIFTREYSVTINAKDFNTTMNPMIRSFPSGTTIDKHTDSPFVWNDFSESTWRPYFNQINLYHEKTGEPLITARLPRPVRVRSDMSITYKLRLDI